MSIKSTIIASFAKIVLGSTLFERIKATVIRVDGDDMPGSEKRNAVLDELKVIGVSTATYLLNLGIELAVSYLKTLSEKQK
jgi:hypothetical protein